MHAQEEKKQESHERAFQGAESSALLQFSAPPFEDNRPEANQLRSLQAAANQSSQVQQFKSLQDTANGSDQVQKTAQLQANANASQNPAPQQKNNTGLPDHLKSGIENLSGMDLGDVNVHYNSSKPAQMQAHAYAQGTDIHLASGQEKHLPHEAWHVVQQKQGRVQPTQQLESGAAINDDQGLEKEADVMGAKALSNSVSRPAQLKKFTPGRAEGVAQRVVKIKGGTGTGTYKKSKRGWTWDVLWDHLSDAGLDQITKTTVKHYVMAEDLEAFDTLEAFYNRYKRSKKKRVRSSKKKKDTDDSSSDDQKKKHKKRRFSPEVLEARKQLTDKGFLLDNGTYATGFKNKHSKMQKAPGRIARFGGDDRRLEQKKRQLTTVLLHHYSKGVEFQMHYDTENNIVLLASNKSEISKEVFNNIQEHDTFKEYLEDGLGVSKIKSRYGNRGQKLKSTGQDNSVTRRSSKLYSSMNNSNWGNKYGGKKRLEKTIGMVDLLKTAKSSDVEELIAKKDYDPKDFESGKIYFVTKNLLVSGTKKEEHAEVNLFGYPGVEPVGPKINCLTCYQKGKNRKVTNRDSARGLGKLFTGQIPKDGTKYDQDFVDDISESINDFDETTASSKFQYENSESEASEDESDKPLIISKSKHKRKRVKRKSRKNGNNSNNSSSQVGDKNNKMDIEK